MLLGFQISRPGRIIPSPMASPIPPHQSASAPSSPVGLKMVEFTKCFYLPNPPFNPHNIPVK